MFCANCGKELAEGWTACPHCGQVVGDVPNINGESAVQDSGRKKVSAKKDKNQDKEVTGPKKKVVLSKGILLEKAINKASGKNTKTVKVSCQELLDMVNKIFVQPATTEEELEEIRKKCSKKFFKSIVLANYLPSKDGRYALFIDFSGHGIAAAINKRARVQDLEANVNYDLQKTSELKKFTKAVKELVNARKAALNIAIIEDDDDDEEDDFPDEIVEETAGAVETEIIGTAESEVFGAEAAAFETADPGVTETVKPEAVEAAEPKVVEAAEPEAAAMPKSPEINQEKTTPQPEQPAAGKSSYAELIELKNLLDMGILTEEEFAAKKKEILGI